ncbi:MAG: hypothetical protein H6742_08460 [Alphaproteobacteria bacterium]|nr:hypothetical protein [Alphaproteobacteria bacterium]
MRPLLLALGLCALAPPALAGIDREDVLDNAALFATHPWTMGAANQTASCSASYVSDYSPGQSYRGIPYDWGGWVTTDEYDDALAAGYGAGSHSWHGVLSCTVGVDCSGFVSQAWETSQKYGTATFHQVTHDISSADLLRGDALNDAGSHIVLFAYQSAAGIPIHYEANGALVFVDSDQGWSAFSGYTPIRFDEIGDDSARGTTSSPHEIDAFPFEDLRWTAGARSDSFDHYSCAPGTDESGPEQLYRFEVATAGTLTVRVSDDDGVDVDIHVLSAADPDACVARDDRELSVDLTPGTWWIAADTWVGTYEYPGPYLLTATFTGSTGDAGGTGDAPDTGVAAADDGDTGSAAGDAPGGGQGGGPDDPPSAEGGSGRTPGGPRPGDRQALDGMGGGCDLGGNLASGGVLLLLPLLALRMRRERRRVKA